MNARSDEIEVVRDHYCPPAPDVLVVVFGALAVALDDDGLHIRIIDPRTAWR